MKKYLIIVLGILQMNCATTGELAKIKDFAIESNTKMTIISTVDPLNLVPMLENELMSLGIEICPLEVAQEAIKSESSTIIGEKENKLSIDNKTTSRAVTYIPTSIAIDIKYNYRTYPAVTYITNMYIRLMDLRDKKILASFAYSGSEMVYALPKDLIRDFVKKINVFIK
jgi:hypothetical protein